MVVLKYQAINIKTESVSRGFGKRSAIYSKSSFIMKYFYQVSLKKSFMWSWALLIRQSIRHHSTSHYSLKKSANVSKTVWVILWNLFAATNSNIYFQKKMTRLLLVTKEKGPLIRILSWSSWRKNSITVIIYVDLEE